MTVRSNFIEFHADFGKYAIIGTSFWTVDPFLKNPESVTGY